MATNQSTRRGLLGAMAVALLMAAPLAASLATTGVTPFRAAHNRYVALRDYLDSPASNHDQGATQRFLDAAMKMDATPVATWAEFADAYVAACDDGASVITEDVQEKLLADVRRLVAKGAH